MPTLGNSQLFTPMLDLRFPDQRGISRKLTRCSRIWMSSKYLLDPAFIVGIDVCSSAGPTLILDDPVDPRDMVCG